MSFTMFYIITVLLSLLSLYYKEKVYIYLNVDDREQGGGIIVSFIPVLNLGVILICPLITSFVLIKYAIRVYILKTGDTPQSNFMTN